MQRIRREGFHSSSSESPTRNRKVGFCMGHIETGKFKGVDSSEERKGGPQKGVRRNQVTTKLVRLSA